MLIWEGLATTIVTSHTKLPQADTKCMNVPSTGSNSLRISSTEKRCHYQRLFANIRIDSDNSGNYSIFLHGRDFPDKRLEGEIVSFVFNMIAES